MYWYLILKVNIKYLVSILDSLMPSKIYRVSWRKGNNSTTRKLLICIQNIVIYICPTQIIYESY